MRLTTDELPELPLAAAWFRGDGTAMAHTPEWRAGGADTVQYRCGSMRLVVETADHSPAIGDLSRRVLAELDDLTAAAPAELAAVRRALCAALRLVMGIPDTAERSVTDVLETTRLAAEEENVTLRLADGAGEISVAGGDTIALVLKQLATNARKHDEAEDLSLSASADGSFRLTWRGIGANGPVITSRHPDQRERWGLGLVRLAADALGASVIPVRHLDGGEAEAVFAPLAAQGRFTLPLAAISEDGTVQRATRAWDEETGRTPGASLDAGLAQLWRRARETPGQSVSDGPFTARAGLRWAWIALAPRSTRDYARDLIAGIAHERALVGDGQDATRLIGTAEALSLLLGAKAEMWLLDGMRDALPAACSAFGVTQLSLRGTGRAAPSAPLVAFLAGEGGGGSLEINDESWFFAPRRWNPLLEELLSLEPLPTTSDLLPA